MRESLRAVVESSSFRQLRAQIRTSLGVVPFVGAGLSAACGLPGWTDLLTRLADQAATGVTVRELLARGQYEEAAEVVERATGARRFADLLVAILGAPVRPAGAVLRVPQLTRGPVITTNFDAVLETVFEHNDAAFSLTSSGGDVPAVIGALHQDRPYLVKLHGDLLDANNRVLTLSEYNRHYGPESHSRLTSLPRLLEQIFTTRTLLFLGCSLRFDRTLELLRRVKATHAAPPVHYAILENQPDPGWLQARQQELRLLNIEPVWYPVGRHELVPEIVSALLEPEERRLLRRTGTRGTTYRGALAVDFGTCFSLAAYSSDEGEIRFVPVPGRDERALLPSVVDFVSEHEFYVGSSAPTPHVLLSARHAKRHLATEQAFRVGRHKRSAQEIATLIIRSLLRNAEDHFGEAPSEVIVSVPANFSVVQTNALLGACAAAGVRVKRAIGEPCAAALNAWRAAVEGGGDDEALLVVDLGGGTLDVAVVTVGEDVVEVIGSCGDNALGGIDFDHALYAWCMKLAQDRVGPVALERSQDIAVEAERAKIALSDGRSTTLLLRDLEQPGGRLVDVEVPLEPADLARCTVALVERFNGCISEVLRRSGVDPGNIGSIMLAGQGTRVPVLRQRLLARFPGRGVRTEYQHNAVARGLAQYARVLEGRESRLLLLDVLYRSLAVSCVRIANDPHVSEDVLGIFKVLLPFARRPEHTAVLEAAEPRRETMVILESGVTIPTLGAIPVSIRSHRGGPVSVTLVELDSVLRDSALHAGTVTFEASAGDSEWLLFVDVDASHTIVLVAVEVGRRKVIGCHKLNNAEMGLSRAELGFLRSTLTDGGFEVGALDAFIKSSTIEG
jgi:actin-like ATPase involved in cell morphogenesis